MDLQQLYQILSTNPTLSVAVLIGIMSIIQVSPIQINPWSFVGKICKSSLNWAGNQLNQTVTTKIDKLEKDIEDISKKVEEVDLKNDQNRMKELRWMILCFANTLGDDKEQHSVEEFDDIYAAYEEYEELLKKRSQKNGRTNRAMKKVDKYYALSEGYIKQD